MGTKKTNSAPFSLVQFVDYDTGAGGMGDAMMDGALHDQLMLPDHLQQPLSEPLKQLLNSQQRSSPFESFIRRWASIGNGYGRKITRAATY